MKTPFKIRLRCEHCRYNLNLGRAYEERGDHLLKDVRKLRGIVHDLFAALQAKDRMKREIAHFDPQAIEDACKSDLAAALRAIADAVEARQIDGTGVSVMGNGFARDSRIHLVLKIGLAADARKTLPVSLTNETPQLPEDCLAD